jgi:chromosome segregation ATPase
MRTKAHQIAHDPESLREDIFVYKRALKEKKKINEELKLRHEELERENQDYENFIQNNPYFWNNSDKTESKLLTSLKKQEAQLQEQLKLKQLEFEDATKSVKNTRLREMDIEIEELEEESKRLAAILAEIMQGPNGKLEQGMTEVEQKYHKKKNLIGFLKRDNAEMETTLRILSEQNKGYRADLERQEQEIAECDDVLASLKKDLQKKQDQIKMLRREDHDPQVRENEKKVKAELE